MIMPGSARFPRRWAVAAGSAVLLLAALVSTHSGELGAAPDSAIDLVARAGASSNPFLANGDGVGSGFVELGIEPQIWDRDEKRELALQGHIRQRQYFRNYNSETSAGLAATASERVTERLTVGAALSFDTSRVGSFNSDTRGLVATPVQGPGNVPVLPAVDPTNIDLIDPDIGLTGTGLRRNFVAGSSSLSYQLSPRDSVNASVGFTRADYPKLEIASYRSFGVAAGYSRQLSPTTTIGGRLSAERTEYEAGGVRANVLRPQLTVSRRLSETLFVDAAVGLLLIDSKAGELSHTSTGLSLDVNGCRRLQRTAMCLFASRDASSTGLGGLGTQTSIGANVSRQLGQYESVSFAASYDSISQRVLRGQPGLDPRFGLDRDVRLLTTSASYERRLNRRLSAGVTAAYRDLYGFGRSPNADVSALAFVRASFGDRRR